ncbi:MAG: bifunctional anthranilate synthase component I family protein/class IV aminotransferase [Ideonella sp.]|nr:bifunctional anthranilate synthase component I family protein/class IV aminotransferase [Ideonella sp.]
MRDAPEVWALLDDSQQDTSRLYTDFVREHHCADPATLDSLWQQVEADQACGLHAVLLADYEWGVALQRQRGWPSEQATSAPSLRVLLFASLQHLGAADTAACLQAQDGGAAQPSTAGTMGLQPSMSESAYVQAVEAVQEAIRSGVSYQVNLSLRLNGALLGTPVGLYRRLRARQPVAYGAYIALPEGGEVLSLSPELFLRHQHGALTARPMKGTAARLADPVADAQAARTLQQDPKNRAENLMIVDLLRNDIGRIAQTGSVQVPALFSIEPYATVYQMTSTVQARPRPEVSFPDVLRATYPCGSITGAPKHQTLGLIEHLETTPRGLYCGAIGWVDAAPAGQALGEFCLSVAIRTIMLGPPCATTATRPLRLGVGAGIVLDSVGADEWQECQHKARFLTDVDPGFELFETMSVDASAQPHAPERAESGAPDVPLRAAHLARLARSAQMLGFVWREADVQQALDQAMASWAQTQHTTPAHTDAYRPTARLRLSLNHRGTVTTEIEPLPDLPPGPVRVSLSPQRLPDVQPLAAHKTTLRQHYDAAVREAIDQGEFDQLFVTQGGWLTEGGRSSVFVKLDGQWCTPPVADGALPGVARAQILAQGLEGQAVVERRIMAHELAHAQGLRVCNALRGVLVATLNNQAASIDPGQSSRRWP